MNVSSRKRVLKNVSIGPYRTVKYGVELHPPIISDKTKNIQQHGGLFDPRMGIVDRSGVRSCRDDTGKCMGTSGIIPLTNNKIISPLFEKVMIRFLRLFLIQTEDTEMRLYPHMEIADLVSKHSDKKGFRRFIAIVKDMPKKAVWKVKESGNIEYKGMSKNEEGINITIQELEDMLKDLSSRMAIDRRRPINEDEGYGITYEMLGINDIISRPEYFIIDAIPIMNNVLRPQSIYQNTRDDKARYNEIYSNIVGNINNVEKIRENYSSLIMADSNSLNSNVFTSQKEGFIRGDMLSKVGGQIMRSVVAPNPRMRPNQVGLPRKLAKFVSQKVLVTEDNISRISKMIQDGYIDYIYHRGTGEYIRLSKGRKPVLEVGKTLVLRSLQEGDVVVLNRQPTLHKNSILGFEVVLHDEEVIYVHPSASKGFAMDFDGDEGNVISPFTEAAVREVKELMFIDHNMASLASSSLLAGYHQDVNLAVHMLTLDATYLPVKIWHKLAMSTYLLLYSPRRSVHSNHPMNKYKIVPTYAEWFNHHLNRCLKHNVNIFSGRSLYSALVPDTLEWILDKCKIVDGILVSGILDDRTSSGSAGSLGLVLYRTYGSSTCIEWLNASYRILNEFLLYFGSTLSFSDIEVTEWQSAEISRLNDEYNRRVDLLFDVDSIQDPVLRARKEVEITQELNNIRENIAIIVMKPANPGLALSVRGTINGTVTLYHDGYQIYNGDQHGALPDYGQYRSNTEICLNFPIVYPDGYQQVDMNTITFDGTGMHLELDMYSGLMKIGTYSYTMNTVNRIKCQIITGDRLIDLDRTYEVPNQLLMMIQSGARGNATNAVQITGIVGQQIYDNGRVPRIMDDTCIKLGNDVAACGSRSLPCFIPGENNPESRGFISHSYLQGMNIPQFYMAHIASRENLTSNYILTPQTGYFSRKLGTFTGNLKIQKLDKSLYVTDENGRILMYDYILDPSKMFALDNSTTFVDVKYEYDNLRREFRNRAIYIRIPVQKRLEDYVNYDTAIKSAVSTYESVNIVIGVDPAIETRHPDFYEYIHKILPDDLKSGLVVLTLPDNEQHFYLTLIQYESILVIPPSNRIMIPSLSLDMDDGVSAYLSLLRPGIDRVKINNIRENEPLTDNEILSIMINGSDYDRYPYLVRPTIMASQMIKTHTLFETLISTGYICPY